MLWNVPITPRFNSAKWLSTVLNGGTARLHVFLGLVIDGSVARELIAEWIDRACRSSGPTYGRRA